MRHLNIDTLMPPVTPLGTGKVHTAKMHFHKVMSLLAPSLHHDSVVENCVPNGTLQEYTREGHDVSFGFSSTIDCRYSF